MIAFVSRKILKSSKWYYLLVVVANFSIIQKINNFFHCLDIKKYNYELVNLNEYYQVFKTQVI